MVVLLGVRTQGGFTSSSLSEDTSPPLSSFCTLSASASLLPALCAVMGKAVGEGEALVVMRSDARE